MVKIRGGANGSPDLHRRRPDLRFRGVGHLGVHNRMNLSYEQRLALSKDPEVLAWLKECKEKIVKRMREEGIEVNETDFNLGINVAPD